jgi:hypothetical protein
MMCAVNDPVRIFPHRHRADIDPRHENFVLENLLCDVKRDINGNGNGHKGLNTLTVCH